jgi:exopolyphosphatase/guanosine-5'-triphosphate,3'-diphosphate pyrophosphatase
MHSGTLLAAVDLGSNSFRLEIGRHDHGQIQRVDYLKETVRLGSGLDSERHLTDEAMQRGWACLSRFHERLSGFDTSQVRVVATQTLREAKNRDAFIRQGSEVLGFPIEVIAGTEEARLIYQGVAHLLPPTSERRLVIDIGGRSTELILGQGMQASETNSFRLGSVAWSLKYFPDGRFTEQTLERAEIAAQAVLEEAQSLYARQLWDVAYGSSGTVGAVADILSVAGWPEGVIELEGLKWLRKCLLRAGHAQQLSLEGLKEDRRPVIGGGVCVLHALMELLKIETLHVAQGALRHGVLFEMLERSDQATDTRDVSVKRLAKKFGVDHAQVKRVQATADHFYRQMSEAKDNASATAKQALAKQALAKRELDWACELHEIGIAISHSDYHKHGAYILDNADMLGFTMPELHRLGLIILGHKGKLRKLEQELDDIDLAQALMALRLAVILCHARKAPDCDSLHLRCQPNKRVFTLKATSAWTDAHPQSTHLLRLEMTAWERSSWRMVFMTES